MGLQFENEDWIQHVEAQKEKIIDEIAAQLSREHPEIFEGGLFKSFAGDKKKEAETLVREAVLSRDDLTGPEAQDVIRSIMGQATGYGVLQEFFGPGSEEITEIFINPTSEGPRVFYSMHGRPRAAEGTYFKGNSQVKEYCQKIVQDAGKEFIEDAPIVDAWLQDGSRIAVIGYKASPMGVAATIRKSPMTRPPMPLSKLVEFKMLPQFAADMLVDLAVKGHANIGVFGRTDSGKTTFLRSLASFIDPMERTFIAETSFEMFIPHLKNCVNLTEVYFRDKAVVDMTHLCKTLNRNNPDRAIVGELRSKEIIAASQIASSTSGGFWTTGHAGDVNDLRTRLFGMFLDGGVQLPKEFLDEQISSMFDVLVFLDKETMTKERRRTLISIEEVTRDGYRTILEFDREEFARSQGKTRRWIYKNTFSEERLAAFAFAGGDVKPEYEKIEKEYLLAEDSKGGEI